MEWKIHINFIKKTLLKPHSIQYFFIRKTKEYLWECLTDGIGLEKRWSVQGQVVKGSLRGAVRQGKNGTRSQAGPVSSHRTLSI